MGRPNPQLLNLNLRGDAFWKQLSEPLNNISIEEVTHLINLYKTHINRPISTILDCCCGTGLSTHYLKQLFPTAIVSGIDLSPVAIKIASNHWKDDIKWVCGNAGTYLKNSNHIDLIFAMGPSYSILPWLVPLARKVSGNLVSFSAASWTNGVDRRSPSMGSQLIAVDGRNKVLDLIFVHNPVYFEYDRYKIYTIY